jgi:pyruvate dehydrogenase E1 component beta subunit
LENELVYGTAFPVPEQVLTPDFVLPIGKAKIEVAGDHVTLVSHSKGVQHCLEAAEELKGGGINAEVRAQEKGNSRKYFRF